MTNHLLGPDDLSPAEIDELLSLAKKIIANPMDYADVAKGKILATLFYEPSTRTRLSFETAMLRLGGQVIGFSDANSTSAKKGEGIQDTIRTVAAYSDIIAIRHPVEGAPYLAAKYSDVPIINAGDGGHHHPSQTLTDLLTIWEMKGRLDNLKIALARDLKFGRTVHSLVESLLKHKGNKFFFVSPEGLEIPDYIKEKIPADAIVETHNLEDVLPEVDVLYMTRIQKERFADPDEYAMFADACILDNEKLKGAKEDMIILHPLPIDKEILFEVDDDPRAAYFKQVKYGMYARMALIYTLLNRSFVKGYEREGVVAKGIVAKCQNPKCVTNNANVQSAKWLYTDKARTVCRCEYCDWILKNE